MPKVSVVMTVYNSQKYLKEAIESILNQTFRDFEFIIVDDASTDQAAEIIRSYKDQRIILLTNSRNLGQTKSLNIGIRRAQGQYIARMDADDICELTRLQLQVEYLEAHKDIALVGSWALRIDEEGKQGTLFKTPTDPLMIKCYLAGSGELSYWCIIHPTVMLHRTIFEEVGFYNEEKGDIQGYPQDYEFWGKVFTKFKIANLDKALLRYRILKTSDSRKYAIKQLDYRFEITSKKVQSFVPDFKEEQINSLSNMLEFRPQSSSIKGKAVLNLFDHYFDQVLKEEKDHPNAQNIKRKLKFYYLPQLYLTNKLLAIKEYFKNIFFHPLSFFDIKFYRKIFKAFSINDQLSKSGFVFQGA